MGNKAKVAAPAVNVDDFEVDPRDKKIAELTAAVEKLTRLGNQTTLEVERVVCNECGNEDCEFHGVERQNRMARDRHGRHVLV